MRKPNFSNMATDELQQYRELVTAELEGRENQEAEQEKIWAKMEALAQAEGFELDDLLNLKKPAKKAKTTTKAAPKYQHPKDASLQWTGRGRQPKWLVEYLASGKKTLNSLLIKS